MSYCHVILHTVGRSSWSVTFCGGRGLAGQYHTERRVPVDLCAACYKYRWASSRMPTNFFVLRKNNAAILRKRVDTSLGSTICLHMIDRGRSPSLPYEVSQHWQEPVDSLRVFIVQYMIQNAIQDYSIFEEYRSRIHPCEFLGENYKGVAQIKFGHNKQASVTRQRF